MLGAAYTCMAMLAFAANSVLCRLALRDGAIDPASFTAVRLLSGALVLLITFMLVRRGSRLRGHGSWLSAAMLFLYAIAFSYAYISLSAGTGALILFGAVQGTMIAIGLWSGDRPGAFEWYGWLLAFAGMLWLLLPGVEAPPIFGAGLMLVAGTAWGIYSIRGRKESDALAATSSNFILTVPMVIVVLIMLAVPTLNNAVFSARGIALAILSGALTSGIGYIVWYAALEYLTAMRAALVQLSVPAIATAGGVLLLSEPLTMRLLSASVLVLGGLSLALLQKPRRG